MITRFLLGLVFATIIVLSIFAIKLMEDLRHGNVRIAETYYINRIPEQVTREIPRVHQPKANVRVRTHEKTKEKRPENVKIEKPENTEASTVSEIPEVSTVPEVSEVPEVQEPIKDQEISEIPESKENIHLNSIQKHANDPQNVHDTQIVKSLSIKYKRLMHLHNEYNKDAYKEIVDAGISPAEFKVAKINRCMEEFREYAKDYISKGLRSNKFRQDVANEIVKKISAVMKEILKARALVSLTSGNEIVREDWIFTIIWEHINTTQDTEIQNNLRESFISQIIDCAGKSDNRAALLALHLLGFMHHDMLPEYSVVCINGRVGRMLSSMTLIDSDPVLGAPEKDEAEIANEIYTKIGKLFEDGISANPEFRKMYISGSDDSKVLEFIDSVKNNISNTIRSEYNSLVQDDKLTNIIHKAISGI